MQMTETTELQIINFFNHNYNFLKDDECWLRKWQKAVIVITINPPYHAFAAVLALASKAKRIKCLFPDYAIAFVVLDLDNLFCSKWLSLNI